MVSPATVVVSAGCNVVDAGGATDVACHSESRHEAKSSALLLFSTASAMVAMMNAKRATLRKKISLLFRMRSGDKQEMVQKSFGNSYRLTAYSTKDISEGHFSALVIEQRTLSSHRCHEQR